MASFDPKYIKFLFKLYQNLHSLKIYLFLFSRKVFDPNEILFNRYRIIEYIGICRFNFSFSFKNLSINECVNNI